jgi:hypothetical protein
MRRLTGETAQQKPSDSPMGDNAGTDGWLFDKNVRTIQKKSLTIVQLSGISG